MPSWIEIETPANDQESRRFAGFGYLLARHFLDLHLRRRSKKCLVKDCPARLDLRGMAESPETRLIAPVACAPRPCEQKGTPSVAVSSPQLGAKVFFFWPCRGQVASEALDA